MIYECLSQIAYTFIENNQELFENKNDEFETFINYFDSHIRFLDEDVNTAFERWFIKRD